MEGHRPGRQAAEEEMNNPNLENLFSVTLRDAGKIALIDGDSKKIVSILNTGYAVHISRMSASAVICSWWPRCQDQPDRPVDGKPDTVARNQGRRGSPLGGSSKAKGWEDKYAIAGTYWPPQAVIMDGDTLKPRKIVPTRGMTVVDTQNTTPGTARLPPSWPRTTTRSSSSTSKETGMVYSVDYRDLKNLKSR